MIEKAIQIVNNIVWSPTLVVLLVGAGLYFTVRTRFVQVRKIPDMVRMLFGGKRSGTASGMSSFQAFCLALSGRVGTGNIVGVATAIAMGGPGAVFWMWVVAFFGAATSFTESTLANRYRFRDKSGWRGGPACYISRGLKAEWLAVLFAIFTILGYGMLLVLVQSNGVSTAFENSFSISPLTTGIGAATILALIIVGGARRIAKVASVVTPFMAIAYVLMSLVIVFVNIDKVPAVFALIIKSAFGAGQVFGGIVGSAISMGVKRGLFSNEAGEGGGAIVSASADVTAPASQGLAQSFSVYVDTFFVCTATALMILCTGTYNVFGPDGEILMAGAPELGHNYVGYTQAAIDTVFHGFGSTFVSIALAFFALTTIMAYYFYAESSIIFLWRKTSSSAWKTLTVWIYRFAIVGLVVLGSCTASDTVWTLGDIGVGMTTWINMIALLILFPRALKALNELERTDKKPQHS